MKIICYDFEVFPKDTLGGFLIIKEDGNLELYQTWNLEEIKQFYFDNHKNSIFVSHNGFHYDQLIMQEIINDKNPYTISKQIVNNNYKGRCYLDIMEFDCMRVRRTPFSLKLTEIVAGKSIETSEVDFELQRELTDEEKKKTEEYNGHDLNQTLYNFKRFFPQFELRLSIGKTFGISVKDALKLTEAQLAARVLGAHRDESLKYKAFPPVLWSTLKVKNKEVLNFYLNEEYKTKNLMVTICGCEHTLGKGGIHAAENKVHYDKVIYFDVGGFYNRIMINLDLFPRTMDEEAKQRYITMFHDQLKMKGVPEKANARKAYKTILLSVFGAMNNEYSDFYDPNKFILVTLSGQLYLIDLLEKLEGLVQVVQSNTDGIMIVPFNWEDESKIDAIVKEWETRTGFEMEKDYLYNLWQRDVNCYFGIDKKGKVDYKGDVINYMTDDAAYGACKLFDASNPPIIAKGLIDCLLFGKDPEQTVEENKKDLKLFQYPCKKGTFDYMTEDKYVFTLNTRGKQVSQLYNTRPVKPLNRVFAKKLEMINGMQTYTILTKHKDKDGKHSKSKVANLPDSVFIYNKDITNAYEELKDKIDYEYYVNRIYEKIGEFVLEE